MKRMRSGNRMLSFLLTAAMVLAPVQTGWAAGNGLEEDHQPVTEADDSRSTDAEKEHSQPSAGKEDENISGTEENRQDGTVKEDPDASGTPNDEETSDDSQTSDKSETSDETKEPDAGEMPDAADATERPDTEAEPDETEQPDTEETSDESEQPDAEEGPELPEEKVMSEEPEGEETPFAGLQERSMMSQEMWAEKQELNEHIGDLDGLVEGKDYEAGTIIVSADSREEAEQYAQAYNGALMDYMEGAALITLSDEVTVMEAVESSADEELLLPAAWPNYYRYASEDPFTDPSTAGEQYQYYHDIISSNVAHRYGYKGKGVKVAVLDTGIKSGHEDVKAKALDNGSASDNYGAEDAQGHGTHVAGIIGAEADNGKGGKGVAPEVELISIKVLDDSGSGSTWAGIAGIRKAIDQKVDIINMSLGSYGYVPQEETACNDACKNGILVVAAAGNESTNGVSYPAGHKSTLSVAALDSNNTKAYFSNYGPTVDYCAPGVGIWSTYCKENEKYYMMDGTSQATPVVAGTAAVLLASSESVRNLTGTERVDALRKLMDKGVMKAGSTGVGKGYINLAKALNLASADTVPAAPEFSEKSKTTFNETSHTIRCTAAEGMKIYYTVNGKAVSYKDGTVMPENALEYDPVRGIELTGAASFSVKAIAVNPVSNLASKQVTATYKLQPDAEYVSITSPVAVDIAGYSYCSRLLPGKSVKLGTSVEPFYAKKPRVTWRVADRSSGKGVTVNQQGKVTVARTTQPGMYEIQAAVGNRYDSHYIEVVNGGNLIKSVAVSSKKITLFSGKTSDVSVTVKKQTGTGLPEDLHWASGDCAVAEVVTENPEKGIQITGVGAGKTTVTGTALDGSGKKVSIAVTVNDSICVRPAVCSLAAGKSITLKAAVSPSNAAVKVEWSEESGSLKITPGGKVTVNSGVSGGTYTVKAEAKDGSGVYGTATVKVIPAASAVTKLKIAKTASVFRVTNKYGASTSAILPVTAEGGTDWEVSVNNPELATAERIGSSVRITATGKAAGKVKVTVASTDGSNKKAVCTVSVDNPITKMYIAPEAGRMNLLSKGRSMKLTAVLQNASGKLSPTSKNIKWTSSDSAVIKVDGKKGTVTALKEGGSAVITAEATDGSCATAEYRVTAIASLQKIATVIDRAGNDWYIQNGNEIDIPLELVWTGGGYYNTSLPLTVEVKGTVVSAYMEWRRVSGKPVPILVLVPTSEVFETGKGSATISVKDIYGNKKKFSCKIQFGTYMKDGKKVIGFFVQ